MRCPFCSAVETHVIDSRLVKENNQIRRRRECKQCQERFTTYEVAELSFPRILKSDDRREVFNEEKLRNGILRAIEKRPIAIDSADSIITKIKHTLRTYSGAEISSQKLGCWVMEYLRMIDQVAYVRFASVYRKFEDVDAFLEEIEQLQQDLPLEIKENQLDLLEPNGE